MTSPYSVYGASGSNPDEERRSFRRPGDPMVAPSSSTAELLDYAPGPARDFMTARSEFSSGGGSPARAKMVALAKRVAGRLALDYHGIMFQSIDPDAERYAAENELKAARYAAQIETYNAITSYARRHNPEYQLRSKGGEADNDDDEPATPAPPPLIAANDKDADVDDDPKQMDVDVDAEKRRVRELMKYSTSTSSARERSSLADLQALAQMLSTSEIPPQGRQPFRCSSSSGYGVATSIDPRIRTEPFPIGNTFAPKDLFVENVRHAAALVAEARNEGREDPEYWENIVDTADEVLYDRFADLVALCIVDSSQRLINRALDVKKSFENRRQFTAIFDAFANARRTSDGRLAGVNPGLLATTERFDPVAEALDFAGYGRPGRFGSAYY